jgi:hypothetical protein
VIPVDNVTLVRREDQRIITVEQMLMARWPRHAWTTLFTYGTMFLLFSVLCWLAYAFVRGWLF